jgi:hypothetical protein
VRGKGRLGTVLLVVAVSGVILAARPAGALSACAGGGPCPVANDDNYSVRYGTTLTVAAPGVLANDKGPNTTTVVSYDQTSFAATTNNVTMKPDGSFTYTNPPGYAGPDTFTYTVDDGLGDQATATVNVIVNGYVTADSYNAPFNAPLTVAAPGVLANDGGMTDIVNYDSTSVHGGEVDMSGLDGSFTYIPAPCFSGTDTFTYTAEDANFDTPPPATVTVHVAARPAGSGCTPCSGLQPICPYAVDDSYSAFYNTTLNVAAPGVEANDFGASTIIGYDATSADGGAVTMNEATGAFSYVPPQNFTGEDSFTYTIDDGFGIGDTDTGTVTIHVAPAMTKPTALFTLPRTIGVAWTPPGLSDFSDTIDTSYQTAAWNGAYGSVRVWQTGLTNGSANFTGTYGTTYCFRGRTEDDIGVASGWSAPRCTAIPMRANGFAYSSGWTVQAISPVFSGLSYITRKANVTATRTGIQATHLSLLATTCSTCGAVRVYWNNVYVRTLSLVASTTHRMQQLPIAAWTSVHAGTLKLVTVYTNKLVTVEGIAISRA